jgi:hypothetical protein
MSGTLFFVSLTLSGRLVWLIDILPGSGLARTFGRAAGARSTPIARRAFEPLRFNALSTPSARWASTEAARVGKIHQVIGAVVDGMSVPIAHQPNKGPSEMVP